MNEFYEQYKKLKTQLSYNYKGYCIEEILAIRIWIFCQYGPMGRESFRSRKSYGNLFQGEKDCLMIYGRYGRKDHEYTFDCVHKRLEDKYDSIKLEQHPDVTQASIKNILLSFWLIFVALKTRGMNFRSKLFWTSCFCYIFNTIDHLESMPERHIRKLLCFSAIHEDENILKQYFRKHGATTYSMFHGTNIQQIHNVTIDCLTYENLDVDYSLPWGQYGKDEFVKTGFPAEKLLVAGYPREMKLLPINRKSKISRCVLLMSRSQFEATDTKLMNMLANQKQINFSVKLHPSCNEPKFSVLCAEYGMDLIPKTTLLSDCLNNTNYDFAVAVNTTSYYEALVAGLPCMRYKDGDKYDMMQGDSHDEFEDESGFVKSLCWMEQCIQSGQYDAVRKSILTYCIGYDIDKYREILI